MSRHALRNALALFALIWLLPACSASAESSRSLERDFPKLDTSRTTIKLKEIQSGGVRRDSIPAIMVPRFTDVADVSDLPGTEPVIFLEGECGAVAFPYRILIWHEIVHHSHCGVPVAVTFCPLCNTSMVFDRRVGERILSFGTTGRLRHSDLIMYDHQTETFWQQFTGEAIVGTFTGSRLKPLPARIESYDRFVAAHPDGKVLSPPPGFMRQYGLSPYPRYDVGGSRMLYDGKMPRGIAPLARVVRVDDRAWALKYVRQQGTVQTDDGLTIAWTPGQNSALHQRQISKGRDIGNIRVTRDGQSVPFSVDFAFAFHAFYPESTIVK